MFNRAEVFLLWFKSTFFNVSVLYTLLYTLLCNLESVHLLKFLLHNIPKQNIVRFTAYTFQYMFISIKGTKHNLWTVVK